MNIRKKTIKYFDFGENWEKFSENALNEDKINQARSDFNKLFFNIRLKEKCFLDIGFGQGLSLLLAAEKGALPVGLEINKKCKYTFKRNMEKFFPHLKRVKIPIETGSILDEEIIQKIQKHSGSKEFDIVHSWGVLHHTGNMKQAIINSSGLLKKNGFLILAIYNRHWTSRFWLYIKKIYNVSPGIIKKIMILFFSPIILIAKKLVTRNSRRNERLRGMDFYYDLIDWLGGYPYEYASIEEVIKIGKILKLRCLKVNKPRVPTGCNEFVFKKIGGK